MCGVVGTEQLEQDDAGYEEGAGDGCGSVGDEVVVFGGAGDEVGVCYGGGEGFGKGQSGRSWGRICRRSRRSGVGLRHRGRFG